MPTGFEPYVRCFRCRTSRPSSRLLANVCNDGFCLRVLEIDGTSSLAARSPEPAVESTGTIGAQERLKKDPLAR